MFYVTRRSHRMPKDKFDVTCPNAIFMETTLGPHENEKYLVDVLHPGRIGMRYMTRRSYRTDKHKFGVTCPDVHFMEPHRAHSSMKNSALTFHAPYTHEHTM
jgi:hypothetical protein